MGGNMREIGIAVARESTDRRPVDIYVLDGAKRIGRYQVRTNADGKRDVYYSDIEGDSFNKVRKVQRQISSSSGIDPVISSIESDLASRGLSAPALREEGFRI